MPLWLRLRRLRGPAFLVLVGITALLNQWSILRFSRSWPLYLILAGLFGLAERAALGALPMYPAPYIPAAPAGAYAPGYSTGGYGAGGFPTPGSSLVPSSHAPAALVPEYGAPALSAGPSLAVPHANDPERRS